MKVIQIKYLNLFALLILSCSLFGQVNKYPLDTDYHKNKDVLSSINRWSKAYPSVFYSEVIGYSSNDKLPIRSFKISFNPNEKQFDKPSILIIGQIHASEPLGVEICMGFAEYLLKNYQKNERIKSLLRAYSFHFIPTLNPEGFEVVSSGTYANHRKNKSDTNANKRFDRGIDGVDINRNFPLNWNNEIQSLSTDPYYAGPSPASENETIAIMDYMRRERFYLTVNYHSSFLGDHNERIFFPWNWSGTKSPHWHEMKAIATIFSKNLKGDYSTSNYLVHTGNTSKVGFFRDWAYSETGTYFFDIEVGGIYKKKSIIFPENKMRQVIVNKNIQALVNTLEYLDINTKRIKIINENSKPVILSPICYNTLNQTQVKPLMSNEKGMLFIFIPQDKKKINLYIADKKYIVKKSNNNKATITIKE